MKRALLSVLIVAAALVPGVPVAAQQFQDLKVSSKKAYKHKHSKLTFPATLAGAERVTIKVLDDDQLDIFGVYESRDRAEIVTLYIYRNVAGSIPVWFDRARWAIENRRDVYGEALASPIPPTFTPPGQAAASGLIASYTISEPPYRSTGIAILPMGEWIVKLRYSSQTLESASLASRMREALAELDWPEMRLGSTAITPLAACEKPLALSGESKPAKLDGAALILNATLANMGDDKKAITTAPVTWCRDSTALTSGGVYRPDGATDRYLIALSDAGRGILVQPDVGSTLLRKSKGSSGPGDWLVSVVDMASTSFLQPQDRLPPPEQVLKTILAGPTTSTTRTWGEKPQITINSGALSE